MFDFLINILIRTICMILAAFIGGLLVVKKEVKVNYTRKINHFLLFFLPLFIDYILPFEVTPLISIISLFCGLLYLTIYIKPIRERISFINTAFLSFDRPEDRPHSLLLLWTQVVAGYLVMVPMILYFGMINRYEFIFIPILITGLGDGLAEPIGVRFGKHKYKCYSLFSKEKHVRSLEGSACVLIVSFICILITFPFFTLQQFIIALITIPIVMTLAEAFSPHTWDNPFLFLACGIMLFIILQF